MNELVEILKKVNELEPQIQLLTMDQLRAKTEYFKEKLRTGATLDDILPEAFAVVRETARRVINMRHFDCQIVGGVVLHKGHIAEMATGEGKTLVATLPLYLNALTGKGCHLVTVNDYLAKRDRFWMGPVYEALGLTVGLIQHDMQTPERRKAYACDITYGTNNEFGFDYLRDNMAWRPEDQVQRPLHYAIVDEVDSILIDEARTPLIISGPSEESVSLYYEIDRVVRRLKKDQDYTIDEESQTASLTEEGVAKCEKMLNIQNLYDITNTEIVHHIIQSLRAHNFYKKDDQYIVKDGKVIIVDEFTGRLMPGRRWSDGLHQAVEAKEGVQIESENQTLATISFQNYFRLYEKLAGMTGTALTEAVELKTIYKTDVIVIPTNKPLNRREFDDEIYKTEKEKFEAVVEEIEALYKKGRPVLVGTTSIEKSERLSRMLLRKNIPHQVLNAKFHEKEAEIIARAGQKFAVTIATNMAGRGTDIVLGQGVVESSCIEPQTGTAKCCIACEDDCTKCFKSRKFNECKTASSIPCGLHVIGTERHEARRIDNQLKGRAGRQGDPGSARFYLSLEDDLLRIFGSDRLKGIMGQLPEGEKIKHPLITRMINNAQRKVEARNFEIRKQLLEFDDVMNEQRKVIYGIRQDVLTGRNLDVYLEDFIKETVEEAVSEHLNIQAKPDNWNVSALSAHIKNIFNVSLDLKMPESLRDIQEWRYDLSEEIIKSLKDALEKQKENTGELFYEVLRFIFLQAIDHRWKSHLRSIDELREGIGLRAYGQKDVVVAYKQEAFLLFQEMLESIRHEVLTHLFRVRVSEKAVAFAPTKVFVPAQYSHAEFNQFDTVKTPEKVPVGSPVSATLDQGAAVGTGIQPVKVGKKIGRNEPCPCGSGKKYKKCCGANK
ncbi:MAG: preprotein translocase subunit SecA [Candidatus Omnitrophica bacterium]|nr:preprotein translocase subunit SecA [Candidatus Omnitrophota bacterium]